MIYHTDTYTERYKVVKKNEVELSCTKKDPSLRHNNKNKTVQNTHTLLVRL